MGHTPYGYRIENGIAIVDEEKAKAVVKLFEGYLDGLGLQEAANTAGIPVKHRQAKLMMLNKKYQGTDYYPALVTKELAERVKEEIKKRAEKLGRIYEPKEKEIKKAETKFIISTIEKCFQNPYHQAEYIYSLIEGVNANG